MSAPYMPLFVSDYLADTAHLSAAEHGAYLMLLMNYWQRQKPLPAEDKKLARIARMTDDEWSDARETIAEMFQEVDGLWQHKRVDAELSRLGDLAAKAAAAGKASGLARRARSELNGNERPFNDRSTTVEPSGKARQESTSGSSDSTAPGGCATRDLDLIESECRAAAEATNNPSPALADVSPIIRCLDGGATMNGDVLPTLRRFRGKIIRSWAYAVPAIMDAKAARETPLPAGHATGPPSTRTPTAAEQSRKLRDAIERAENEQRQREADRPAYPVLAIVSGNG